MSHMLSFYGPTCCHSLYSCSPTKHAHHLGRRSVRCQNTRPQDWTMRSKEATPREPPTHTNYPGVGCSWESMGETAPWAPGRPMKEYQKPLQTKVFNHTEINKASREALEATHLSRTSGRANQVIGLLQEPIFTNQKPGQQLPTPTASTTKRNLEMLWQQQLTQFAK